MTRGSIGRLGLFDAPEQYRMGDRRVGAGDQNAFGAIDVFVGARRRVGPQGLLVASHGRRHAETRVGIEVVGTDQPLRQFVEDVIVFGQELAREIEKSDGIRTMRADGVGKAAAAWSSATSQPTSARSSSRARRRRSLSRR